MGYPVDAFVVRQDRVLVAEYYGGKVTERDFQGKIVWEQNVGSRPIGVQGLANGNIFVVTQNRLVEYDREHREVFSFNRPFNDIFRARKLRNGEVVFVTNAGQLTRMEPVKQTTIKTFRVGNLGILFGSIDVLPDGGVLVPNYSLGQVVEYDADGQQRFQFAARTPNSVMRLPNGNTLVGSQSSGRVVEFNRTGVEVSSINTSGGALINMRRR